MFIGEGGGEEDDGGEEFRLLCEAMAHVKEF
jgi:hypothetical protein